MVKYNYRDCEYSIVPCILEDIPSHIERVLSYWKSTGTNLNKQYELLEECVYTNTSFKIIKNSTETVGYFYCKPISKRVYMVVFTWFKNGLVLSIGLDYIYRYTSIEYVKFLPHQRNKVSYKSLLTTFNILCYRNSVEPITVDVKNEKITSIYKRYFINRDVKRIADNG